MTAPPFEIGIITDLDGTLLTDGTRSMPDSVTLIQHLRRHGAKICFATSKTLREAKKIVDSIGADGVIFENGAGLWHHQSSTPIRHKLRIPIDRLTRAFEHWRSNNDSRDIRSIMELDDEQLRDITGLSTSECDDARARSFTLPIYVERGPRADRIRDDLLESDRIRTKHGGRFLHLQGDHDKGDFLGQLRWMWGNSRRWIGIGNAESDAGLLARADVAAFIDGGRAETPRDTLDEDVLCGDVEPIVATTWHEAVEVAMQRFA